MVPTPLRPGARRLYGLYGEAAYRFWKLRLGSDPVLSRPIFMLGCPRGGTSISVALFGTHPWVANWSEAMEVWDPDGHLDPEADHEWTASDVEDEDARRLHARFEWYRQHHHKRRFINKHPRSSVRIDYIDAVFPDALYIHVIRDGRAVASSILNKVRKEPLRQTIPFGNFCKPPGWRNYLNRSPVEQAGLQWRDIVNYVLERRSRIGGRYFEYRYEDMCTDTKGMFRRLFEFAGLPSDHEHMREIPDSLENQNHKNISMLSEDELSALNTIQGPLLTKLGYEI